MTTFLIVLGIIAVLALLLIISYNGLVRLRNKAQEGWSGIDVQLKRRHDLIPNLVETVKGYASHERQTLEAVVQARQQAVAAEGGAVGDVAQAEGMLTQMLGKVFALSEAYPQLKANENFQQLQMELSNTEDQIAASRRIYNGNVQMYNTKLQSFPAVLYARTMGFLTREFFEIEDPAERQNISVSF